MVDNDVYRPHTLEEIAKIAAPEVVAWLNPDKEYGVQWFNCQKVGRETISEPDGEGGRLYRIRRTFAWRPREEWIGVPVPAYLSRDLVDQARATMASNKGLERKHLAREWELRGLMRCSCGAKMVTHSTQPDSRHLYHYYTCRKLKDLRKMGPCRQRSLQASSVEPMIWEFISDLLKNPELIRAGMNALIERKRAAKSREAGEEAAVWVKNLAECARLRSAYQDQQAAGLMTLEELGSKLKDLEGTRKLAQAELTVLEVQEERVEELKKDRDALLESWAGILPEALQDLRGEERNRIYRMLRLEVTPTPEGYSVTGALAGFLYSRTDTSRPMLL